MRTIAEFTETAGMESECRSRDCETVVTALSVCGQLIVPYCDECEERKQKGIIQRRLKDAKDAAANRYQSILRRFPAYDPEKTRWSEISEEIKTACSAWMDRDDESKGLCLAGTTGSGKTRAVFGLMARLAAQGVIVGYRTHIEIAELGAAAACGDASAAMKLDEFKKSAVVVIDDLGKASPTDRANQTLYALIEHCTTRGKPIIFTSQARGEWLIDRFGQDAGEAIVRRLAEFCIKDA